MSNLALNISDLIVKNPVFVASGCFGYGMNYASVFDPNVLGGFSLKGLSLHSSLGNEGIRGMYTRGGVLNSIGLENPGLEIFLKKYYPLLERKINVPIFCNLHGQSIEEFETLVKNLTHLDKISAFEINISCPNVKNSSLFSEDIVATGHLIARLRTLTKKPLWVKISPNFSMFVDLCRTIEENGADGVIVANTFIGSLVDIDKGDFVFNHHYAGYSGPAIYPIVLAMVGKIFTAIQIPIMAVGGVSCLDDALGYFMMGASLIGVGSQIFSNPKLPLEIISGLEDFCNQRHIDVKDLIGIVHRGGFDGYKK